MKKKYLVEFKTTEGVEYTYEFHTDNIEKAILDYTQNKSIVSHKILKEGSENGTKSLLLG